MNSDKLKSVIQAANPEIIKLQPDCEIELEGRIGVIGRMIERHPFFFSAWVFIEDKMRPLSDVKDSEIKILGRPIRLADVLNAVYNSANLTEDTTENVCSEWNMLDDNLDNQSDECKQFLIDLLVK